MTSGSLNPKWNQRPIQFEDSSHDPAASEKAENMRIRKAKSTSTYMENINFREKTGFFKWQQV